MLIWATPFICCDGKNKEQDDYTTDDKKKPQFGKKPGDSKKPTQGGKRPISQVR